MALFETYRAAEDTIAREFGSRPRVRDAHHFVKLPSGLWSTTFGPPGECDIPGHEASVIHISGRRWKMREVTK